MELCKAFNLVYEINRFQTPAQRKETTASPNANLGEIQTDHVSLTREAQREMEKRQRRFGSLFLEDQS